MEIIDRTEKRGGGKGSGSKMNLIIGVTALIVLICMGFYFRTTAYTGEPFKLNIAGTEADPQSLRVKDLFEDGWEIKTRIFGTGSIGFENVDEDYETTAGSYTMSRDGKDYAGFMISKDGGKLSGKRIDNITVYAGGEFEGVKAEGIGEAPVDVSGFTVSALTEALGEPEERASLAGDDITEYEWKRKHYYFTASCYEDGSLFAVEVRFE